ncbi:MAG: ParB/RepB/Spo0J family partition protein [Candidatus Sungbacteria bacterium]|nr:ParB/RepB/Spo0J family partition protein [Candidatus Sungbacteria bacterium]
MSEENISEISVDLIDAPGIAMRSDVYDDDITSLMQSIRERGLLQPVVIRKVGERYEMIAGHRRLVAHKRLGQSVIKAIVKDVDERTALSMRVHENLQRRDVDPVDEALFIFEVMAKLDTSPRDFALEYGRSEKYILDRMEIAQMPEYMHDALRKKEVTLGVALALVQIEDEELRRIYFDICQRDGASVLVAQNFVRQWRERVLSVAPPADIVQTTDTGERREAMTTCERCQVYFPIRLASYVTVHRLGCPSS